MSNEIDGIHMTTERKRWVNKTADGKLLSTHIQRANALAKGISLAKRHGEQFTVHRRDGSVISTRTYGKSPA